MRVVSLVPSVTETLLAWGVEPVACTRFCEQPALAHVGGTKDPDVEAIVALAPDVVVMDEEENRRDDADALRAAGVDVHVTAVRSLGDVALALDALAARLALSPSGVNNPSNPGVIYSSAPRRAVFVPIWRRPWMTVNAQTYGSTLLDAAGFANVFADAADRYPEVTLDDAAGRGPDLVLAPSEPYPFGPKNTAELEAVAPVVLVDGRDLFWWGARTAAALERLADLYRSTERSPSRNPSMMRR
jgi:ABC-type Fe3+-hydroxamate transport system substrate-binding protein